jgi:hypothetical protein
MTAWIDYQCGAQRFMASKNNRRFFDSVAAATFVQEDSFSFE